MKALTAKLGLAVLITLALTGCASIGPPQPPSLELPKPPSDLRAVRKGNTVTLTWSVPKRTTDRQTVRSLGPTRICRSETALADCKTPVGEAPATLPDTRTRDSAVRKQSVHYADTLPEGADHNPLSTVTYAVEVLNRDGRGAGVSNQVTVPAMATPGPPAITAQTVKDGVQLSWQLASSLSADASLKYKIRLFRRGKGEEKRVLVSERGMDSGTSGGQFVDDRIEWERTYEYSGTIVTVIRVAGRPDIQIESDDSNEAEVVAHDIFPPSTPTGVQAVFTAEGQNNFIDLIWTPVNDPDLAGYNVYRHEAGTAAVLLNAKPQSPPSYRDSSVSAGRDYFYSVSAVDARGNESGRSEETFENVPKSHE